MSTQSEALNPMDLHGSCFSRTPAFRLAEQWIYQAAKRIEVYTAENGSLEGFATLRESHRGARELLGQGCLGGVDELPGLSEQLRRYLHVEDFHPAEVPGAFWLVTPMGEIPLLALPAGDVNELTCRSKAHILVGLASSHESNPLAAGFLYLSDPASFQRYTDPQGVGSGWLQSQRIMPVDGWGLRALLVALRCAAETNERLSAVSNPSVSR